MKERREKDEQEVTGLTEDYKKKLQKEADEFSEAAAKKTSGVLGKFQQATGLVFDILKMLGVVTIAIPVVRQAIAGIQLLWNSVTSAFGVYTKEGVYTRGIKSVVGLTTLGLAIAMLAAPAVALTLGFIALGIGMGQELWILTAALISRSRGSWKKERDQHAKDEHEFYELLSQDPVPYLKIVDKERQFVSIKNKIDEYEEKISQFQNKGDIAAANELTKDKHEFEKAYEERQEFINGLSKDEKRLLELDKKNLKTSNYLRGRDAQLASRVHGFTLGVVAVIGVALLVTPFAPIGAALLLATSIYGVMNTFDFPGKWASKVSNFFFGPKKQESIITTTKKLDEFEQKNKTTLKQAPQKKFEKSPAELVKKPKIGEGEAEIFQSLGVDKSKIGVSSSTNANVAVSSVSKVLQPPVADKVVVKEETESEGEKLNRKPN